MTHSILRFLLTVCLLLGTTATSAANNDPKKGASSWEKSIVLFDITGTRYNYRIPWDKRAGTVSKFGAVIEANEILTSASGLENHTLVRIQKGGRGKWWNGKVDWIDHQVNLAVVHVENAGFWSDLEPVQFAGPEKLKQDLRIVRWRGGNLETRAAEFSRFTVADANFNQAPRLEMKVSSEIENAGSVELAISGSKVVGLVVGQASDTCTVLPSPFIQSILSVRKSGKYKGLGYFDFIWQPASNPATTEFLKLEGEPRGVVVIKPSTRPGVTPVLKPRDVILEVDGFPVDIQGDYENPDYGHLIMEHLATRNRWAGDDVPLTVLRGGEILNIDYRLPKADFSKNLVSDGPPGKEPRYLISGGLLFQPLSVEYLKSWGTDWQRRAPFRLTYYNNEKPKKDQPSLVVLSMVLPDFYNVGYQNARHLVVKKVNGQLVATLGDIVRQLESPVDGFHVVEFKKGQMLERIILDAEKLEETDRRITARYGIVSDRKL